MSPKNLVIVVSAPSGAGKHTVLEQVRKADRGLATTVSATTRPPRASEADGREYYFLSREEFERRIAAGEFIEFAVVHDNMYGTFESELDRCLDSGKDVLLELDVQGMRDLKRMRRDAVTVFITAPSLEELERRLRRRGTEADHVIGLRLRNAKAEIDARREYDYIVVNDALDNAVADMQAIIRAERCRSDRQP